MGPARLVERYGVLPLLIDRRTQSLAVVAADLDQLDVDKQIAMTAQVRSVNLYVARPRTVRALIRRWYYGDSKPVQAILESLRAPVAAAAPANTSGGAPGIDLSGYGNVGDDDDDYGAPAPVAKPAAPAGIDMSFGKPAAAPSPGLADFEDIPGLSGGPAPAPAPQKAPTPAAPVMPAFSLPAFALDGGGINLSGPGASAPAEAKPAPG